MTDRNKMKQSNNISNMSSYHKKKVFFESLLTLYGRKPVHEALSQKEIKAYRLHLAQSNRPVKILTEIISMAESKGVEIRYHDRPSLSRISKNGRQDQGAVLDIEAPAYHPLTQLDILPGIELIALENVTNPQNVGMIIRSVGASPCQGLILPKKGCAKIDPLVIKASAGTALKVPIYYCDEAYPALSYLKEQKVQLTGLSSRGEGRLSELDTSQPRVFVLGNETKGLSKPVLDLCDELVRIPLNNQVESLNVSVVASIVAFRSIV